MAPVPRGRPNPPDPADAPAFRAARDACRRHGADFYFATAFLPPAKRDAAHAVFAFWRMIGDAMESGGGADAGSGPALRHRPLGVARGPTAVVSGAGGCCSPNAQDQRLALFRDRLNDLYEGRLELPAVPGRSQEHHVLHAFSVAARRYQIPRECFVELAEARRSDQAVTRYATWSSLQRYCARAGGAAAVAVGCVLGVTHSGAADYAAGAGTAAVLTKVLRDLKPDLARGHVYLPLEDLAAFRYSERDLAAGVVNDAFRKLMRFEIDRARRLYREAADGLCWVAGDGSRFAAAALLAWQSGLLDAIERRGYDVFSQRPALTAGQKLRRLPHAWRLARRRPGAAPRGPGPRDAAPLASSPW